MLLLDFKSAPILGNFTEEEANGSLVPQDTLEFPLQRDEVQTLNTKGERNHQTPQSEYLEFSIFWKIGSRFNLVPDMAFALGFSPFCSL